MAYEAIEKHLVEIGIAPLGGGEFTPIGGGIWDELELPEGARMPEVIQWFFERFGGSRFPEGVFYDDPKYGRDVMVGWFLDESELRDAWEATREELPADVVPIANDGGDNHVAIGVGAGNGGVVYFHVHDAPEGANLYEIDRSAEHFLASLHREE